VQAIERAVNPLDVARRAALRAASRSGFLTRVLGRRDSRVAVVATIQILVLFALSLRAPVAMFFLGPVLFGVIHLAADVRYLVLRRTLPRTLLFASLFFALTLTATRFAVGMAALRTRSGERLDVAIGVAWIGLAFFIALRGRRRWAAIGAPLFMLLSVWLVAHAHVVGLALAHLHNVIALVTWLVLFRRRVSWTIVPLMLVFALVAVLLSGSTLRWTFERGGMFAYGMHAEHLAAWLAPGVRPDLSIALAVCFVFLQGVHYAAWIGWIPQDDLRGEGTLTFRMTVRSLSADFGPGPLLVIAAAVLAFAGMALWNVRTSVLWYMTLARSHAWFECALLAYFVVRRARLGGREA
jgi:hypothetical protein